jgi:hypothetical protein
MSDGFAAYKLKKLKWQALPIDLFILTALLMAFSTLAEWGFISPEQALCNAGLYLGTEDYTCQDVSMYRF